LLAARDLPVPACDTDPLNLDSLSLAWLVHLLDVELDVRVELSAVQDDSFDSVASLVRHINQKTVP